MAKSSRNGREAVITRAGFRSVKVVLKTEKVFVEAFNASVIVRQLSAQEQRDIAFEVGDEGMESMTPEERFELNCNTLQLSVLADDGDPLFETDEDVELLMKHSLEVYSSLLAVCRRLNSGDPEELEKN